MTFYAIDEKLLELLQIDSKQTNKELSSNLNLSITAVYERIKKLENNGVIDKYVALINKEKIDKAFVAFCHIKLMQHSQEFVTRFEKEVVKIDEVVECYADMMKMRGKYDENNENLSKAHAIKEKQNYKKQRLPHIALRRETLRTIGVLGETHRQDAELVSLHTLPIQGALMIVLPLH